MARVPCSQRLHLKYGMKPMRNTEILINQSDGTHVNVQVPLSGAGNSTHVEQATSNCPSSWLDRSLTFGDTCGIHDQKYSIGSLRCTRSPFPFSHATFGEFLRVSHPFFSPHIYLLDVS